ncbi:MULTISPECIES: Tim44 domain-containing protein [Cupriavidus]|uniref:Tim44 domain-containing protein n=1 Tax=Cupriavidus TaxID=106589 RepID=UPI0023E8367C|nr:TIM44-like domain-containing protein [Cupriavidus basilensis]MDF3889333.1 TIM44-like domain-containing protein [Cupriavidus basilensis]
MSLFRARFMAGVLIGALALGMALDANAKRLGGSRSVGKQSSGVTQRQQAPAQQSPNQTPAQQQPAQQAAPAGAAAGAGAAAAAAPKRNWGGMLGGIAAGLGIGWLLSHFGLGGAAMGFLSNLILIALVAFAAIWLIRKFRGGASRPQQPAYAGAGAGSGPGGMGGSNEPVLRQQVPAGASNPVMSGSGAASPLQSAAPVMAGAAAAAAVAQPWGVPADFDTEAFLRNAKVYYVRLQAAWDAGNLEDIREFTTPEMFAEIKMDLSERGAEVNKTDVVTLEGELLGIEDSPAQHLASVRFSGMIREKAGEPAQPFAEVWNLAKPVTGSGGWLLAGIQQVS